MRKKGVLTIVGILLSVGSLVYVFQDVSMKNLMASMDRILFWPLLVSVLLYWGGLVIVRTLLVRYILSSGSRTSFFRVYRCICIGFLANNVFPFRIGDLARSVAVSKASDIPLSTVFGGLALERMLDFFMAALIAFGAIMTVPAVPRSIQTTATAAAIVVGFGFGVLLVLARRSHEEHTSGTVGAWVWNLWIRFSRGFGVFRTLRGLGWFLLLGGLMWTLGVGSMMARLVAFDLPMSVPSALLVFACLGFGVALPSAPGYVGVYQMAVTIALTTIGVDKEVAAAFGLFSWVVDIAVGNIAGAISMSVEGMTIRDLHRVSSIDRGPAQPDQ